LTLLKNSGIMIGKRTDIFIWSMVTRNHNGKFMKKNENANS